MLGTVADGKHVRVRGWEYCSLSLGCRVWALSVSSTNGSRVEEAMLLQSQPACGTPWVDPQPWCCWCCMCICDAASWWCSANATCL